MTIRYTKILTGLSLVALLAMAPDAYAQKAATLGDVMTNTGNAFSNFPNLLSAAAYLMGLFFAIKAVFEFKEHVEKSGVMGPPPPGLSTSIKKFVAGGMMLSAPYMASVLQNSLFAGNNSGLKIGSVHAKSGGGGMDGMVFDLIANVAGPMTILLTVFSYIAATILLLVGITRLTKTAQEGPRGPGGMGTIMTFLAAGALFSSSNMMGSFSSSLFGSSTVSTYANIDPKVLSGDDANKVASVIEALMTFVMIVGYIAFLRGWFVLKAFADGHQNATLAQALTFLFGGALAINLGALVNVLGKTVGVSGITFS